jgi:CHAT domain-containing protein/Tfp pilus assembly protein PilF
LAALLSAANDLRAAHRLLFCTLSIWLFCPFHISFYPIYIFNLVYSFHIIKEQRVMFMLFRDSFYILIGLLLISLFHSTVPAVWAHQLSPSIQEETKVDKGVSVLERGRDRELELKAGESHSYRIGLASGQYLQLIVEQRAIDVVIELFGPDGGKLITIDTPDLNQGNELLSWVAETAGEYRIEVRSLSETAPPGRYTIKVAEQRIATAQDSIRISAQKLFMEATQLNKQETAQSRMKAVEKYTETLPIWRSLRDRRGEATTLTYLAEVYKETGDNQKLLDTCKQALLIWRDLSDRLMEAKVLDSIGTACYFLGENQKALENYNLALKLRREDGDRIGTAETLNNIGIVYYSQSEYQKALDYYTESLSIARESGSRKREVEARLVTILIYIELGESQKALESSKEALSIVQVMGDRFLEAYTYTLMGKAHSTLFERQKALDLYNQALPIYRELGYRPGEASLLNNIARVQNDLGEYQKAIESYEKALQLWRTLGDRLGESATLHNIGTAYFRTGDKQKATDHYRQALEIRRAISEQVGEADTLSSIAAVEFSRNNLDEARSLVEQSIAIIESMRIKVASHQLRATYLALMRSRYEFYVDILMQLHKRQPSKGYDALALQTSESARARSLLETLAEARADIRQGVDSKLLEHEHFLQQQLNIKATSQTKLLKGKHMPEQASAIAKEIDELTTEYQLLQAQIRLTSPRYAALTQPSPLGLKDIQKMLDADTLLLEYLLGDDRSYLWAITQNSISAYELPKREEINRAARSVYELLTARNRRVPEESLEKRRERITRAQSEYPQAAATLSRILLGPVSSQLGMKRLVIVADGILLYVPLQALPSPIEADTPLIVEHEIVSLPSASTLSILRQEQSSRKPSAKAVAVFADPVFDLNDPRVKLSPNSAKRGQSKDSKEALVAARSIEDLERSTREVGVVSTEQLILPRLPSTREEAEVIKSFVPASDRRVALGFEANRILATSAELEQYRIIHFASHGLLNSAHPELSGIALSLVDEKGEAQDGFLRLHDIYNLKLPAELVVLSACQTGLGKEIKGEGLIGLTRGFMYAGATRVMASLWKVDDEATAELMRRFYEGMLKDGQKPASALRSAQVGMLKQKRWQSPFYWAAFVLQGEWY